MQRRGCGKVIVQGKENYEKYKKKKKKTKKIKNIPSKFGTIFQMKKTETKPEISSEPKPLAS